MSEFLNGSFILIAQTPGAEVKLFHLAANHDGSGMDIGRPTPVSMAFGVADVRTINGSFPANVALQFSMSPSVSRYGILQNPPIHSNIMLRDKQEVQYRLT